jgi:hypothetical protein
MATITKGKTFSNGELVTPASLHALVDSATLANIVNADIASNAAIADTKLATISTANKVSQSAVTNLTTDLAGKAASSHVHSASDITSGVLSHTRMGATASNIGGTIVSRNDSGQAFFNLLGVISTEASSQVLSVYTSTGNSTAYIGGIVSNSTQTGVAYNTTSDYRLKTNIEPLTAAVARLLQIPARRFNWLADPTAPKVDGFLAHEAQAVVPEAVTGTKDAVDADGKPIYQGIDQSKLVPLLVAAVQELAARVASLESR